MTQKWSEGFPDPKSCQFCIRPSIDAIQEALSDKYTFVKNSDYLKSTNEIVEGERITPSTVAFLEWQFLEDQEETLKRYYYDFEYTKRNQRFGEYYEFHREFPRFCDVDIYRIKRRYCEKMREHQYKVVKRILNDPHQSVSEFTKTEERQQDSKQTAVENILGEIQREESKLEESNVFIDIVGELKELTKDREENSFDLGINPYEKKTSGTALEVYLQRMGKKGKKFQNSISTEGRLPMFGRVTNQEYQRNTLKPPGPKIIKNFSCNNFLIKLQRHDNKETRANSLERTKSTFNLSKVPFWLNKEDRQRSIEKVYGKQNRYSSIDSKHSDNPLNPESQKPKSNYNFRISQIPHKDSHREVTLTKPISFKFINKSKIKRETQLLSEQETIGTSPQKIRFPDRTERRQVKSPPKIGSFLAAKNSDPNDRNKESKQKKKLDLVKVYKKIKGIV